MEQGNKKKISIFGISLYRICGYFIIYSILGFVLETLFALVVYGKLESRQGFLYGPFCSIYGVGAVFMIVALQKFKKNGYTIFLGEMLVGSIVEYIISLFGELILNVRWWDYSERHFNIAGRICLLYSIYWGIVAIYLMKSLNPHVDKFIDWIKRKINDKALRISTIVMIVFLLIDCVFSGIAINTFLARTAIENDLSVIDQERYEETYEYFYKNDTRKKFVDLFWNEKKIIRTYPNLRLTLSDGTVVYVRDYYPNAKTYYYKFDNLGLK